MSDKPKVYVAGIGMITPVGANAEMTAAAVRAGVSAYQDTAILNKKFEPIKMALVPEEAMPPLKKELAGTFFSGRHARMLRLAGVAMTETLASIPLKEPVPLFLAGPETPPGFEAVIQANFLDHLVIQSGAKIDRGMSRLLATGRAGGIQAVNLADKYFESTGKDVVLVGAVDSFFDSVLLGKLDFEDRLSSDSVNGFVPGEGAGFLLLVSQRVISKLPVRHKAVLYLPGLAEEPGHRYAAEPYRGDGLANAFRSALKQSDGLPVKAIFSSMNGEHFWAKEMGVAMTRNQAAISEGARIEHPADCFGDIGAAIGPVLIGLMSMDKPASYLACCSSEQQARAAIVAQAVAHQ